MDSFQSRHQVVNICQHLIFTNTLEVALRTEGPLAEKIEEYTRRLNNEIRLLCDIMRKKRPNPTEETAVANKLLHAAEMWILTLLNSRDRAEHLSQLESCSHPVDSLSGSLQSDITYPTIW